MLPSQSAGSQDAGLNCMDASNSALIGRMGSICTAILGFSLLHRSCTCAVSDSGTQEESTLPCVGGPRLGPGELDFTCGFTETAVTCTEKPTEGYMNFTIAASAVIAFDFAVSVFPSVFSF